MPWLPGLLHWLNVEYWTASWPNIFAPSVWTLVGVLCSHIHHSIANARRHDELLAEIRKEQQ
jgi:hypothetical protein